MKRKSKQKVIWMLGGAAVGAGLMALLDPTGGRRRRTLIRDLAKRAARPVGDAAAKTWRDLSQRAAGVAEEARRIARGEELSDEILTERVRATIGRLVSRPASIEVWARGGEVTLAGRVQKGELDALLREVRCVRGLERLEDHLEALDPPGSVDVQKAPLEQDKTRAPGAGVTKDETAEETRPAPRKRPAAPRGAAREPGPGGNGPTMVFLI
jgi:hypothetical protein